MIKSAIKRLSYAVFPKRCELCGEVISLDESRCDICKVQKHIEGELCEKCGRSINDCRCTSKTKKPEYKAVIAPYYYEKSIVAAVNRFKDYGYIELAEKMGDEISEFVKEHYKNIPFDAVTFVPMTRNKERKRGFNQSELLAKAVSDNLNSQMLPLLDKIRKTPQQKKSSAKERRINLHGAFDLKSGADVKGKTILLIDDIKTTGSTLNECSLVLKGYGAKAVYAAAFCLTNDEKKK